MLFILFYLLLNISNASSLFLCSWFVCYVIKALPGQPPITSEPSVSAANGSENGRIPRSMSAPISSSRTLGESSTVMTRVPNSDVSDTVSIGIPVIDGVHTAFRWVDNRIGTMAFLHHNGTPLSATEIAQEILRELEWHCPYPKRTYTIDQMVSRIYAERRKAAGDAVSMLSKLELIEYRFTSGAQPQVFIHGIMNVPIIRTAKKRKDHFLDRLIVFSHPELHVFLKAEGVFMLLDATFLCVPRKPYFYQLLIIMIYIAGLDLYVPVVWILMTGKSQPLYEYAFDMVINMCGGLLRPRFISVDFEQALVNALKKKFCAPFGFAIIMGCNFHLKQAWRKKMQNIGFPKDVIKEAMTPGKLDLFRIVNPDDVHLVQDYLFDTLDCLGPHKEKWEAFWKYMEKTWYPNVDLFNVYKKITPSVYQVHQETNNVCERYNQHIQDFLGPHPDLMTFVSKLKEEAETWVERVEQTRRGQRNPPRHRAQADHRLPGEFIDWLSNDPNLRFPTNNSIVNYSQANNAVFADPDPTQPEAPNSSPISGEDVARLFEEEATAAATVPSGVDIGAPQSGSFDVEDSLTRSPAPFSPSRQPATKKQNKSSTPSKNKREKGGKGSSKSKGNNNPPRPTRSGRVPVRNSKYI